MTSESARLPENNQDGLADIAALSPILVRSRVRACQEADSYGFGVLTFRLPLLPIWEEPPRATPVVVRQAEFRSVRQGLARVAGQPDSHPRGVISMPWITTIFWLAGRSTAVDTSSSR
jgi:hypothetical protein